MREEWRGQEDGRREEERRDRRRRRRLAPKRGGGVLQLSSFQSPMARVDDCIG